MDLQLHDRHVLVTGASKGIGFAAARAFAAEGARVTLVSRRAGALAEGQFEQLVGKIQEKYGKTREEAEREVEQWQSGK